MELQYLIFMVIILALIFDFINGFHDTANAIATSVNTRALHPNQAIMMAAGLNFLGAMVSTGVAKTIGGDIVSSPGLIDEKIIIAALIGAIIWNLFTWWFGIPSSSSHALIGGLIGAVLISVGTNGLNWSGIGKIVAGLIASPAIAFVTGIVIILAGCFINAGYNALIWIEPLGEGTQLLDFFDFLSNSVMMPIVALLTCIFVGWIIKPKVIIDEVRASSKFALAGAWTVMIKYIAPVLVIVILVWNIISQFA